MQKIIVSISNINKEYGNITDKTWDVIVEKDLKFPRKKVLFSYPHDTLPAIKSRKELIKVGKIRKESLLNVIHHLLKYLEENNIKNFMLKIVYDPPNSGYFYKEVEMKITKFDLNDLQRRVIELFNELL